MPLILAVDRDRRQATQLVSLVHKKLNAELVQASSAQEALEALAGRVPDLILTSPLISPKDDGVLAGHLRQLGPLAAHVQTLTIPVLKSTRPRRSSKSVLSKLRRDNGASSSATTEGCDPELFAEEISLYLARAAEERQLRSARGTAESASLHDGEAEVVTKAEPIEAADPLVQEFAVDAQTPETTEIAEPQTIINEPEAPQPLIKAASAIIVEPKPEESFEIPIEESLSVAPVIDVVTFDETPTEAPDVAYSAAVEEALASISEPEATQSEEAIEATRAPEDEPALPVPIERLVELFADLQPRSIEVMEPPASVTPAAPPPRKPVLDEDALVEIGEAAWKASFRAAFLKDLGLGASSSPEKPVATEKKEKEKEKEAAASQKSQAPEPLKSQDGRSKKKSRGKTKPPVQDEWGLFDPEQCGFSALVDKLEKVTDSTEEERPRRGTRVRVISY